MAKALLIRVDASITMGTGHVMRMIALAQAWRQSGGNGVFVSADITPPLEQKIRDEGFGVEKITTVPGSREDLAATRAAVSARDAGGRSVAVALDGYQFDGSFQSGLKEAGCRLLVVDDYGHADSYHADFVLNQNISARDALYARKDWGTELLLGPRFALLRQEFLGNHFTQRSIPRRASKLLVTLGGADADNVTKKVIEALAGSGLEVKVAIGGSNPHLESLREAAQTATAGGTRVDLAVNANNMPGLMHWADMAIAAGGSTCWELAFSGLPSIFVILADNQEQNARELERQGFGLCLGRHTDLTGSPLRDAVDRLAGDAASRAAFASRGRELVDGLGAQRVAARLWGDCDLELLPATENDFELLWQWANDPMTRANSFNSSPIPWEKHKDWCHAKLQDVCCCLWMVATPTLGKIGIVRFDRAGPEATVSISLAPEARGKGYGHGIITAACQQLFQSSETKLVRAVIKPENKASTRAFEQAGFLRGEDTAVNHQTAQQYLLHRNH
jgi:UDP-2,4-diacetamido-2,4,6-trideoxy-beta-L-altropyranose hydrolase